MKNMMKYLINKFIKSLRSGFYLLFLAHFLFGCMSVRPMEELKYADGSVAESLSSNVSLSYVSSDKNISGSGVLMFRKPDQIRAVILSPFGSVLQEVYVNGEQVSIIDSGNGTAFSGSYMDLPGKSNFSGWRNIHWLIDIDPPVFSRRTTVIERTNRYGHQEKAAFVNGLLISKITAEGESVWYNRYTTVKGVAFPLEIIYKTVSNEKFTIQLEEPEINVHFADGAFIANLSKFRVYPLTVLK
jgi:outer membrane lipoprotein-sorting protein